MQIKHPIKFQAYFTLGVLAAGLALNVFRLKNPSFSFAPIVYLPYFLSCVLEGFTGLNLMAGYLFGSALEWGLAGYWLSCLPAIFARMFKLYRWPCPPESWWFALKRQRLVIIVAAGLTVVLFRAADYSWSNWSPHGPIVSGPGYEGVLVNNNQFHSWKDWWAPTLSQVRDLETELPGYVRSRRDDFGATLMQRMPDYKRHYLGVTKDGRRLLRVTLIFIGVEGVSRRGWLDGVMIDDGAAVDYWEIYYDPAQRQFTRAVPFDEQWYNDHKPKL